MVIDRTTKSRWRLKILQLTLISLGLIVLFAAAYWAMDALSWGTLQDQNGERAAGFLPFLYFSAETFFRIGYGTQIPVGAMWGIVTLEALTHFVVEIVFIAHLATLGLNRLIAISEHTRLENTLHRF